MGDEIATIARRLNRKQKNALRWAFEEDFNTMKVGPSSLEQVIQMGLLSEETTSPNNFRIMRTSLGEAVYKFLSDRRDL